MKSTGKTILIFAFITLFLTAEASLIRNPSSAKEESLPISISIYPSILDLDINRNQTTTEEVTIRNETEFLMPVKVEISDYSQGENGLPDYSIDPTIWSAKSWITTSPGDFILEPKATQKVLLEMVIPAYAEPGSHFVTVLFKPVLPPDYFQPQSAHIIPYIGAVVALNVERVGNKKTTDFLEVQSFETDTRTLSNTIGFDASLKNTDVFFHKVSGNISILNLLNTEVGKVEIEDSTIFPQKNSSFSKSYGEALFFGRYKAVLNIGEGEYQTSETRTFWVWPSIPQVFIFLAVTVGLVLLIVKRRNVLKAFKTLIAKEA